MTKLTSAQEGLLSEIRAAKAHFDKWETNALAELAVMRNQAKEPLRKLVASAMEEGIPVRQIHQRGMDFKQVSQMSNFLDSGSKLNREGLRELVSLTPPTAQPGKAAVVGGVTAPTVATPEIKQMNFGASWVDPVTGERRTISRLLTANWAFIDDEIWDELTEAERAMFLADKPTIVGKEEYRLFDTEGIEPARWSE